MNLTKLQKIQNDIYLHDCYDFLKEQNFLFFLGNHPTLFQEFIDQEQITIAEMNYICQHFYDYNVDPRNFENEFKREMRELLPRYNLLKKIELQDEIFTFIDDSYDRAIINEHLTELSENGIFRKTENNSNENNSKTANKDLPMESTGNNFDQTVAWDEGASSIAENKNIGTNTINENDVNELKRNGKDNGNSHEYYNHSGEKNIIINRIWSYIVKPKAINWLTGQLSTTFILAF